MKAKVKVEFPGCPDGKTQTRTIEVGEVIEGNLAEVAVREKWAVKVKGAGASESDEADTSNGGTKKRSSRRRTSRKVPPSNTQANTSKESEADAPKGNEADTSKANDGAETS